MKNNKRKGIFFNGLELMFLIVSMLFVWKIILPFVFFGLFMASPPTLAWVEFLLQRDLLGNGFCRQKNIDIEDGVIVIGDFETPKGKVGKHVMAIKTEGEQVELYDRVCPGCMLRKLNATIAIQDGEILRIIVDSKDDKVTQKNIDYFLTAYNLIKKKKEVKANNEMPKM